MNLLITSTEELKEYFSVNTDFDFDQLKSSIDLAQSRYISKLIGETLLESALNDFAAGEGEGESSNENNEKLLKMLKACTAFYAYYLFIDINQVNISDAGIHIKTTEYEKTAFDWQIKDVKETILNTAYDHSERIIKFLEKHIDEYQDWKKSECYTEISSLICHNTEAFNKGYNIGNKRLTYLAYLPKIKYVEDMIVSNMLCDYHDELLDKMHQKSGESEELTPLELKLVDTLQKAIAKLAIAHGIFEFSVELNVFGVIQTTIEDRSGKRGYKPANNQTKEIISNNADIEGNAYLDKAIKIINTNIDTFETYKNSPCYVADEEQNVTGNATEMRPIQRDSFFQT